MMGFSAPFELRSSGSPAFISLVFMAVILLAALPGETSAQRHIPCLDKFHTEDTFVTASPKGSVIFSQNALQKRVPASTLKLLTALAAINYLGLEYRFKTSFFLDSKMNLKMKGFGDPLLISEILGDISLELSERIDSFKDLVLDDTYFSGNITIPGRGMSTNPYDAPVGALCVNFNTIFFRRDSRGRIISAEPQTPIIPFTRNRIKSLGLENGRYTFSHDTGEATRYTGALLTYFLKRAGVTQKGIVRKGVVEPEDKPIHIYYSGFTLKEILEKMLEFSNNFIANQLLIAMGAKYYGPPGTLGKGIKIMSDYASNELDLNDVSFVEGSGISRANRISGMDMLAILNKFKPYRNLLTGRDKFIYKTGSLRGIRNRAGYLIDEKRGLLYPFVIFVNRSGPDMETLMECVKDIIKETDCYTAPSKNIQRQLKRPDEQRLLLFK